jgi:serine/threonine protein kinase/Flp pilus assembly protein TadD
VKNNDWQKIESIFHIALGLTGGDRASYLSRVCSGNLELVAEIKSLLSAFEKEAGFLEEHAFSLGMNVLHEQNPENDLTGNKIGVYEIKKKLGGGGMGDVYLAEDNRLNRPVALKFLKNSLMDNNWARRQLIKEAQAVAMLEHPNICAVHSIDESDAYNFIVMQYIEGDTLAQFIDSAQPSLDQSLSIAVQIVRALAFAHSHGIIHRDVKPGNIIIMPDGLAKVLDFGLAKVIKQKQEENTSQISQNGLVIGTVSYMSPEQLCAEKLDFRSDIFSLGIVLYELFGKQNPFNHKSHAETIAAILKYEPPSLTAPNLQIPAALASIVEKCLSKNKENRFQSAVELLVELENFTNNTGAKPKAAFDFRRIYQALILLFVVCAGLFFYFYRAPLNQGFSSVTVLNPTQNAVPTLAVLPIANESGRSDKDYLGDGLTGSLINKLSRLSSIKVKAKSFVEYYRNAPVNLETVGNELKVDKVLYGKIVQEGSSLLLKVSLVNASDGTLLWSDNFIIEDTKLLSVQEKIFSQLISQLGPLSSEDEQVVSSKTQTKNPEAFQTYLLGQYYRSQRDNKKENILKAIESFTKATDLDPQYAQAWAARAELHLLSVITYEGDLTTGQSFALAKEEAKRALEIDNSLAEPYISLGVIKFRYEWDWQGAENNFRTAIDLNPENPTAHYWYSSLLRLLQRYDEALAEGYKARELDPSDLSNDINIGRIFYYQRDYARGVEFYSRLLEKNPENQSIQYILGFIYFQTGKTEDALGIFEKMYEADPRRAAAGLGYAYGKSGRNADARRILDELERFPKEKYVPPQEKALVYLGLKDKDRVFEDLEKSCAEHNPSLPHLVMLDPLLDELRADSRFTKLIACVNF